MKLKSNQPKVTAEQAGHFGSCFMRCYVTRNAVLTRKRLTALLRGQESGRSKGERLFALVLVELWRWEYGVTF